MVAGLAGTSPPTDRAIDGKDIRALLLSDKPEPTPHLAYYYYFMSHLTGVRSGRWKLHIARAAGRYPNFYPEPVTELYDLHTDIGESTNVAEQHPQVVERLRALAEWASVDLGDGKQQGKNVRPAGFVERAVTLTSN